MTTARGVLCSETPACQALSVLLIEDNRATRQIVASMLRRRGHSVTAVEASEQLLDTYVVGHFDVILMDIEMPHMDGYEAAAAIRHMETHQGVRTPIVALTAHVMEDDRRKCMDAGMDAFLPKPADVRQLIAMLESGALRPGLHDETSAKGNDGTDRQGETVDLAAMMRRLGGDAELLQKFIEVFDEDAPPLLTSIRSAMTAGDAVSLRRAAHALRGLASNFDARRVVEIASRLERADVDAPLESMRNLPGKLAEEVGQVCGELANYRRN